MAELTGFVTATQDEIAKANASSSISRGNSPFQHGTVFTVSGFSYEKAETYDAQTKKTTVSDRVQPVLTTNLGSLFLNTLLRGKVDAEGKVLEPSGTFNAFARETIASMPGKSNGEILSAIVAGCQGKSLLVERVPYSAKSRDGRTYAASLVNIHFKVD